MNKCFSNKPLTISYSKLTLAYFGTPYFSARFLEKLLIDPELKEKIEVKLIVTQPDKPVGKKQVLTPSPVKEIAKKYNLPCFELKNLKLKFRVDLALLYAFGQIISKDLLKIPQFGFWCIHPSLLPKFRGPSPIAYPLILGEEKTGVTLIKMDEKIDHGSIIAQKNLTIEKTDSRPNLEIKLTDLAFQLFKQTMKQIITNNFHQIQLTPQNHQLATYTRFLKKDDGFIPFSILKKALKNEPLTQEELPSLIKSYFTQYPQYLKQYLIKNISQHFENSSQIINNYFRGLSPWPGIWTIVQSKELNNLKKEIVNRDKLINKRLKIIDMKLIKTNLGSFLKIKRVQLEGKKEVDFETFNRAYQIF